MSVAELFDQAAERLVAGHEDVQLGRIMNATGLRTKGRFFGFVRQDELVVKLPAPRVSELISSGEGGVFDAGKSRPMREWVTLQPADVEACVAYLDEAREFVG
jgi:hypothetical protein